MSQTRKKLAISNDDLRLLFGKDWDMFQKKLIPNCLCHHCGYGTQSTIMNYEASLNDLDDVVLKGTCATCGNPVARYVETGENPAYGVRIVQIRKQYDTN